MHDTVGLLPIANPQPATRWFCEYGCVVEEDGVKRVFVGDTLLGEFDPRDRDLGSRNVLLVMLAKEPKTHLGHLAAAFGISDEHLRRLRLAAKADGYGAVLTRARGCAERDELDPAKVRELRALFEEGWNPTDATRRQRRRGRVSRSTVSRERRRWQAEKEAAARGASAAASAATPAEVQQILPGSATVTGGREAETPEGCLQSSVSTSDAQEVPGDATTGIEDAVGALARSSTTACSGDVSGAFTANASASNIYREVIDDSTTAGEANGDIDTVEPTSADGTAAEAVVAGELVAGELPDRGRVPHLAADDEGVPPNDEVTKRTAAGAAELELHEAGADGAPASDECQRGPVAPLRSRPVASGRLVQHVGSWLLIALAQHHGLHQEAERLAGDDDRDATRIALDATLAALAIGERTVEGVRRLATSTAPLLLRCDHTPTANAIRRRLHSFANEHGVRFAVRIGERYLEAARTEANEAAVFYVDNHLRMYTGQEVVRRGWRMQDKRAVPGTSDYYVHDEDGRPVFRIDTPSHESLCHWLMPIVTRLRDGLGMEERILLVFDRAGAFPDEMATLRDAGVEFVTYERRPYPDLARSVFDRKVVVRGETYGVHESRLKNLRDGRGRVRRIALLTHDGKQINLLAVSTAPLEQLVGCLMGEPDPDAPSGRWQEPPAIIHGSGSGGPPWQR